LKRIESHVFPEGTLVAAIPATILFVASDADPFPNKLRLDDGDACPEFGRWLRVRDRGIDVDFRRILRRARGLGSFNESLIDLSAFEEISILDPNRETFRLYRKLDGDTKAVVRSVFLSGSMQQCEIESEIENEMNLSHPLIAAPIGFVYPPADQTVRELKIVRFYSSGPSLAQVLSLRPEWWTPTAKAKAVVGIALAMRFAHSYGLIHGSLKTSNILFHEDGRMQIADFAPIRLQRPEGEYPSNAAFVVGGFSGDGWSPHSDVRAFVSVLCDMGVCPQVNAISASDDETTATLRIPRGISMMLEKTLSDDLAFSFNDVFQILRECHFRFVEGADAEEVSKFVENVETFERSWERQDLCNAKDVS
jgi:hypothetical protein